MSKQYVLTVFILLISLIGFAQNNVNVIVLDSVTNQSVMNAEVSLAATGNKVYTDFKGNALLTDIPNGNQSLLISYAGYKSVVLNLSFPLSDSSTKKIFLSANELELDELVIEATRAHKPVADLPTRTEVLTEEIDEAASMEPSKIAHLITHSTGIQVQTTAASSNGAVVRIQGLNGRYTQMLKDGFPLYGGFSGSLDVLQIPPLDLRQVEYIKGSASTLYGGGAIGGLINLLTKKVTDEETLLHINFSHIGAKDFNAFASRRFGKFGFTNLATFHQQTAYDPDNDGYADIPEVSKINFNPKLFFFPDDKTELYLGATISAERRTGGDMRLIDNQQIDSNQFYLDKQNSNRYTTQLSMKRSITSNSTITLKNSISIYDRLIQINTNALGDDVQFGGQQLNTFSELNYFLNKPKHNLNVGFNAYSDEFSEQQLDTNNLRNQSCFTLGGYLNHLWDIHEQFVLESGLRTDWAQARTKFTQNDGEIFVLPRISALYKLNTNFAFRLGGGMGYRMPTIFNEEAEPFGYKNIQPVDFEVLKPERSYGSNFDFKYRTTFGSDKVLFTFNQMFFYNLISNPILLQADTTDNLFYESFDGNVNSSGFETQLKLTVGKFTWFFGYTYTDAFLQNDNYNRRLSLTPQHSIKGDLLFVVENNWRIGWDYEYKSEQVLSSQLNSPAIFTTGIVVERTLNNFVIFLNAENFTDTRQSKYESLISAPYATPQYTEVWAPLDGFFFNAGIKIKL